VTKDTPSLLIVKIRKSNFDVIYHTLEQVFRLSLEDGKVRKEDLSALSETLLRVPAEQLKTEEFNCGIEPDTLYAWALVRSNISYPYLTLSEAAKKLKSVFSAPDSWGVDEKGKIHIPNPDLLPDSKPWRLIYEWIRYQFPDDLITLDYIPASCPNLDTADYVKYPNLALVLKRLVELGKSPQSATIRNSRDNEDLIKNAVDFVLLETIFNRDHEEYKNLTMSGLSLTTGRRQLVNEIPGPGGRIIRQTTYSGYRLSNYLKEYIELSPNKTLEGEYFVSLFLGIIRKLALKDKTYFTKVEIPKGFFETPSIQIRHLIRQGPQIRTKKGLKFNLYVPLSCVKSSECQAMPEVTKKICTNLGQEILTNLDKINTFPPKESSQKLPLFKEYLDFSYILNDEIKSSWVRNLMIPASSSLEELLRGAFPLEKKEPSKEDISVAKAKLRSLKFSLVTDDKTKLDDLKREVQAVINKKKSRTGRPV